MMKYIKLGILMLILNIINPANSQIAPSYEEHEKIKADFDSASRSLGLCLKNVWLKDGKQAISNLKSEKRTIFINPEEDAAFYLFANEKYCIKEKEKATYELWRFRKILGQETSGYLQSKRDLLGETLSIWAKVWVEYENFRN